MTENGCEKIRVLGMRLVKAKRSSYGGSMRIGIDARMMTPKAARGIGRYIEELVRAMLAIAPEHQYVLVTNRTIHPFAAHPSVETVVANVPWYGLAEQIRMPRILHSLKADVLHVPHWNVPLFIKGPLVITVHDLILRHEPMSARISTHYRALAMVKRSGYRLGLRAALWHADRILVPTHFVASDVRRFYPDTAKKIMITGEGMWRHHTFPHLTEQKPPECKYLLYVGSAYPHKGLDLLIEAWVDLEKMYPDLHLKIVGMEDVFMQRLQNEVQRRKLSRVEFLGYVKDEDLPELYEDAAAFVYPSRFEGFGLPPLEALQRGCPVVASRAASLPEVLGPEGAFFFETGSKTAILQAIETVLRDPVSARQKAMAALPGLYARHDWMAAAKRTIDAYSSSLSCP